jgi:hypothetical protein
VVHIPLGVFLVTFGSCLSGLLEIPSNGLSPYPSQDLQTLLVTSFTISIYCLSILTLLHTEKIDGIDMHPKILLKYRISSRLVIATLTLVLGLGIRLTAINWIYLLSGLLVILVAMEDYGRQLTKNH